MAVSRLAVVNGDQTNRRTVEDFGCVPQSNLRLVAKDVEISSTKVQL
jgi:hypothetical protein